MSKLERNRTLYYMWHNMKARCSDKNNKYYGGRGIEVCLLWQTSFEEFEKFALDNGWAKGLTIDRINNDQGYFPSNIRFISPRDNIRNSRIVKLTKEMVIDILTLRYHIGMTYGQLSRVFNIKYQTIASICRRLVWKDVYDSLFC